ncbi:MAG: hypothetical protein JKY49_03400, partial [Cohaesibacteraceae bacterium]|nr:hypothetical protein [Cohaesibacteraceae bacterium]MBL4876794.1 hypothetical protein [Cohaesibacteraceae bacterium]
LAQVAAVMGENDGNIDNIKMTQRAPDFYEMYVDIGVWNLTHLNRIIHQLRTRDVVSQADRVYD